MFFQGGSSSRLLEAGTGVNAPRDAVGQCPAHLAAGAGAALFLLWQLRTGANLNQQVKNTGVLFLPLLIWHASKSLLCYLHIILSKRGFIYTIVLYEVSGAA